MQSDQNFLCASEVLHELGISYATLLRKVRTAEIPCVRLGKKLLFPRSYFEELERQAYASCEGGTN